MRHSWGRLGMLAGAFVLAASAVMTGGTPAAAAPSVSFDPDLTTIYRNQRIYVSIDGDYAGYATWYSDPGEISTGDTLEAHDARSDGYGIEAQISNGRIATTRGHNAPYTERDSGDVVEDVEYLMWVCVVKGSYQNCSDVVSVWS
ncbi:hypothetical protein ACIOK4_40965 [Streptomyces bottropensis]|uniref:hypothetical protein n=1 Tax=Streptomyces bottropensis TaxID=42235 RepID=UPI003815568F